MNNLVGRRFNRLVVDEMLPKYKMSANGRWLTYCSCTCDCGKQNVIVNASKLKSMHTQSCGCLRKERVAAACKKRCITHGLSDTKAYGVWLSIKDRCYRPTSKAYEYYGGRAYPCVKIGKIVSNLFMIGLSPMDILKSMARETILKRLIE